MTCQKMIRADELHAGGVAMEKPERTTVRIDADRWSCDPLEADTLADEMLVTTSRRLLRLAISAADTGARFTREGLRHDPVAWMLAPRELFDGRPAMDACQDLEHFHRSIVLHGLNMGLDAKPSDIDALLADDGNEDLEASAPEGDADNDGGGHASNVKLTRRHLLTCWIDADQGGGRLFAFCAMVTDRPADLVERVIGRYGSAAAAQAKFYAGFDHTTPLATAMISDVMADTLALVASDPESPLAEGLDVVVEQRFVA